jgi:hypothetical protein
MGPPRSATSRLSGVSVLIEHGPADQVVRLAGLGGVGAVHLEGQRRDPDSDGGGGVDRMVVIGQEAHGGDPPVGDRGERQPACPGASFHHHDPTPGQCEELDPVPVATVEAVDRFAVEDVVAYRREISGVAVGCDGRDAGRAQWDQCDVGPPCCLSYPDLPVSPSRRGTATLTPQVTYLIERTGRSRTTGPDATPRRVPGASCDRCVKGQRYTWARWSM